MQVAVIPYDASREKLDELFHGVNAILYTGIISSSSLNSTVSY